jgi:hypothetical protein
MSDLNVEQQRYVELLKQANEEIQRNGELSLSTQSRLRDQQIASATGLKNFAQSTDVAIGVLGSLASAGTQAGKAMLDGKKGATAFNDSIDSMTNAVTVLGAALALLVPVIGPLVAGVVLATKAVVEYGKESAKMGQNLHKSYQDLARSGGAAADGMTGIKNDALKLGLSMNDLDQMVSLVADNSKDLALFAGSVSDGRKRLVGMVDAMGPAKDGLMNMGLNTKDINEGTAGYLRLQTRLGRSQSMTNEQLAAGAAKYLKEQDALTQLTGQTRKEMEDQRERALQGEQFAAKIRELRIREAQGDTTAGKAADNLLKLNSVFEAAGPKMAAGFQASVTGNLANKDAQELNLASNGEVIRSTQQMMDGQIDFTEAAQRAGKAIGHTADTVGVQLGQLGAYNQNFGDLAQQLKFAQLTGKDFGATLDKINKDQKDREKGADGLVAQQTDLFKAQQAATVATTDFVFKGIKPATDAMIKLANMTEAGAKALDELTPGGASKKGVGEVAGGVATGIAGAAAVGQFGAAVGTAIAPVIGTAIGGALGALVGGAAGYFTGSWLGKKGDQDTAATPPVAGARAEGGPVDAGKLYKVGERGEEYFKPKTAGNIIPNDKINAISTASNDIVKQLHNLEKVTSTDLNNNFQNLVKSTDSKAIAKSITEISDNLQNISKITRDGKVSNQFDDIFNNLQGLSKTTDATDIAKSMVDITGNLQSLDLTNRSILKSTDQLAKITDLDLARTRDFSKLSKNLIDKKTRLMNEEIELLDEQNNIIEKMASEIEKNYGKEKAVAYRKMVIANRATGSMSANSGQGLTMPSAPGSNEPGLKMPPVTAANKPAMGGGQGLQVKNQDELKKLGLNVKEGDVQAQDAKISPNLIELAKSIQAGVPGFNYFSAFNDKFHNEKAPGSQHTQGLAADFTLQEKPSVETGQKISDWLKQMGASFVQDEYNNPSAKATAGHFHVQVPAFEEGGHLGAGEVGIAGEKGKPELVTGPATITPMNDMIGTFNTMIGLLGQQVSMMDEMIRAQKNGNDISNKILRVQQ